MKQCLFSKISLLASTLCQVGLMLAFLSSPVQAKSLAAPLALDTILTQVPPENYGPNSFPDSFLYQVVGGTGPYIYRCEFVPAGGTASATVPYCFGGSAGQYTINPYDFTEAIWEFRVTVEDSTGAIDPTPATYTFRIDYTEPSAILNSKPDSLSNVDSGTFTFSGLDTGSGIARFECRLLQAGTVGTNDFTPCTTPKTYNGLTSGIYTFNVRAVDFVGNIGYAPGYQWIVDITAPDTKIYSRPSDPSDSSTAYFEFGGLDGETEISRLECKLDAGDFDLCDPKGTYLNLANGQHTFQVRAFDGVGNIDPTPATYTWTINAAPPNSPPVALEQTMVTNEDTALNVTLSATDVDGDQLVYQIVTPPTQGTLSGDAPNLVYTPFDNFFGSDSFEFNANDGQSDSNVAVITILVNSVNDLPVADAQNLSIDEDNIGTISLTASDLDNDPLTFTVTTLPTNGALSGTAPNLTYTPNANFNGNDSFTFVANDGQADSATATVNIAVAPVNDAPVANAQQVTVNEDGSMNITLSGSDIDSASLSFVVISQPQNGTLTGSTPNLVYTPNANFDGNDSLIFKVNDGALDSALALVEIGVTPVNDFPVANNDSAATATGSTVINVLNNDSDVDGDPLSITSVGTPAHGSATSNGSTVTYTPNVGYTGQDSFTYTISDGQGGSATAQVLITVSGSTQAQLTIRLVSNPASTRNVSFNGNGGIGTFTLDNPNVDDGDAYLQSKTFTVQPGTYTIAQVTTNAAWYIDSIVCTQPATVSGQSAQIAIQAGQQLECVFTNNQVVAVRARVYNDSDGNGKRTGKDPYVGGWEVRLYDNSGALIGTQLSDSQGRVAFEGLHSGSYSACETLKSGWRSTQPSVLDPNYHQPCYTFVVTPGQVANLLYGNTTLPVGSASIVANMDGIQIELLPEDELENSFVGKIYLPFVNR